MALVTERDSARRYIDEIARLKSELKEYKETLSAIRNGEVDALVISGKAGDRIFTLKGAEHPYRIFIENMNEGAVTLNTDGTILYSNPRFGAFLNQPVERLIGTSIYHAAASAADREALEKLVQGETGSARIIETTLRAADGARVSVKISASRLVMEGASNVCLVVTDMTEHRHLIDARAELDRSRRMSDIGRLSSTIAHEIRNPLAAIRMAIYNIKRKAMNPLIESHVETINKKILESDQIINNLLSFTRIKTATFEPVKILGALKDSIGTVASKYTRGDVEVVQDLACDDTDIIECDPFQFKMLINNILDNAFQALFEGSGRITITARKQQEKAWRISIADTGAGIDSQAMSKLFEPFFTTKSKGTGLGLAVCKEIVDRHHGMIGAASEPGKGTTFTITLPAHQPANRTADTGQQP